MNMSFTGFADGEVGVHAGIGVVVGAVLASAKLNNVLFT